mmetsp:Transcript_8395/g.31086  ORF Transcript_8395/g.31086 Transcript_8395/m.31086 type:complete len:110 (-) Transcript_8395:757-1086(-)
MTPLSNEIVPLHTSEMLQESTLSTNNMTQKSCPSDGILFQSEFSESTIPVVPRDVFQQVNPPGVCGHMPYETIQRTFTEKLNWRERVLRRLKLLDLKGSISGMLKRSQD